jgi:hypothetical protein
MKLTRISVGIKGRGEYTTRIRFNNGLDETDFKLVEYYSTDLPLSSVPVQLASRSSDNESVDFNMLYSKCYERHQFTFHYRSDNGTGFDIDVIVEPRWRDESATLSEVTVVTKSSFVGGESEECWVQYKTKITHPSGQNDMHTSHEESETKSTLPFNINVKYSADVSAPLNFSVTIEIQQRQN